MLQISQSLVCSVVRVRSLDAFLKAALIRTPYRERESRLIGKTDLTFTSFLCTLSGMQLSSK